jgi:hypothetical protein
MKNDEMHYNKTKRNENQKYTLFIDIKVHNIVHHYLGFYMDISNR